MLTKKDSRGGADSGDEDDGDMGAVGAGPDIPNSIHLIPGANSGVSSQLTPNTEMKYNEINREFEKLIENNKMGRSSNGVLQQNGIGASNQNLQNLVSGRKNETFFHEETFVHRMIKFDISACFCQQVNFHLFILSRCKFFFQQIEL